MHLSGVILQEQRQVMSLQQIESINILSMDAQSLHELITKEQEENPLVVPVLCEQLRVAGSGDLWDNSLLNIPYAACETAADVLLPQINMMAFTSVEEAAFRLIAESLNESGLLEVTPEDLSGVSGIPSDVLQKCINVMKTLEPAGVCASSLAECLELQLRSRRIEDALLFEIVKNHLADVAAGHISRIAEKTGSRAHNVKERIVTIKSLNPRPLNGLVGEKARCVVPDIILSREGASWVVELNDGGFRSFETDGRFAQADCGDDLCEYFRQKLQRVKFLNNAIERRRNTLTGIGRIVAQKQSDFILRGGAPAPLSISSTADALGLHASTVSRAVNGKYVQYPGGFRELRDLFARGAERDRERTDRISREGVKRIIRDILDAEEKGALLSDDKIVRRLNLCGIKLSRRTVAKYRSEMGLAGMHNRL